MNGKKKNVLLNGIILAAAVVGLGVYFTVNGSWNAATAAVILILSGMAGFQIWLWKQIDPQIPRDKKRGKEKK